MEHQDRVRAERHARVGIADVTVELLGDSPGETFEADALNVSAGGIAVRSPLLPEIGTRLGCAFASPLDGELIEAECEVVWAADQGPQTGEFGLRFSRLSAESAEALRRFVESGDRVMTDEEARDLGWQAPPAYDPSILALALDGVASELVTEVRHDAEDVLVAEQELPFLRLGTGVTTEDGRRGVLTSVELRVVDEYPRLVLTVMYDDGTLHASDALPTPDVALRAPAELGDDAHVDTAASEASEAGSHERIDALVDHTDDVSGDDDVADDTIPDAAPRGEAAASATVARGEAARSDVATPEASRMRALGEPMLERASLVAGKVRDATGSTLDSAIPAMKETFSKVRDGAMRSAERMPELGVAARGTAMRIQRFVGLVLDKTRSPEVTEAAPRRQQQPRRPDAAPQPARGVVKPQTAPRVRGRHVVVGVVGLIVLVMGARGLSQASDDARSAPAVTPPPVVQAAPALPVAPAPDPAAVQVAAPAAAAPTAPAAVPVVTAPSYEAGQMPQPTYPTLARVETDVVAQEVAPEPPSRSFGAASVPNAMPFELLMTTPIERVSGEVTPTGILVTVTRSNSLTRASPIADAHPDVDRASIQNLAENAVLRLEWKPGRRPAYRIEANGNRLRILLGR